MIFLFTRFMTAANTCLRCKGYSAVPGRPCPFGASLTRASRCFARQCVFFVAQALAQSLEVIKPSLINFWLMTRYR
jgi:hypothetical protein